MPPLVTLKSGLFVLILPDGAVATGASITTGGTTLKVETGEVRAGVGAVSGARAPVVGVAGAERRGQAVRRAAVAAGRDLIGLVNDLLEARVGADFELQPDGARRRSCRGSRSAASAARC